MGTTEKVRSKLYPGPGSHDLPTCLGIHPSLSSSCQYSMGSMAHGTTATSSRRDRLGPGAHHPKWSETSTYKRSLGFGFSKQGRPMNEQSPRLLNAATPHSQLEADDHSSFKKSPKFSFGSMERKEIRGEQRGARRPDPGSYNSNDLVTSRMSSTPAYSASPRREPCEGPVKKSLEPGPGTHSIEACGKSVFKVAPRARFSTAPRGVAEDTPAASRKARSVPGPGQYTANSTRTGQFGNTCSPAWSMPGRAELDLQNVFL